MWRENIETAIRQDIPKEDMINSQHISLAIDTIRCSARSMLHAVMAKRSLWLKPWAADTASKQNWCKIPFDGKALFGEKLDKAISWGTGGKSGLLPQDRRNRSPRGPPSRFQQKITESRDRVRTPG